MTCRLIATSAEYTMSVTTCYVRVTAASFPSAQNRQDIDEKVYEVEI